MHIVSTRSTPANGNAPNLCPNSISTYAGAAGWSITISVGQLPHGHGFDSPPVHTISLPITLIIQVVPPVSDLEMVGVDAATVMTSVAHNLIFTS